MKINDKLKNDGLRGLYYVIRSGLSHEYFIKRTSKIEIDNPPSISYLWNYSDPQIVLF
jgi:hypothetical protein